MIKKTLLIALIIALAATSFVFADGSQSTLSKVSGLSEDQITALRQNHRGYGRIITATVVSKLTDMSIEDVLEANEAGASFFEIAQKKGIDLEQYKKAMLDEKLAYIDEQVKAGTLTEDQAKIIKDRMTEQINNCDGLGNGVGRGNGFGKGMMMRNGNVDGFRGMGRFNQNNSIINQ